MRDIIVSYNNADSRERIRIVTILVRRYKYSHLKNTIPNGSKMTHNWKMKLKILMLSQMKLIKRRKMRKR